MSVESLEQIKNTETLQDNPTILLYNFIITNISTVYKI